MKDRLENEIKVGSRIAYSTASYGELYVGTVKKLIPRDMKDGYKGVDKIQVRGDGNTRDGIIKLQNMVVLNEKVL